MPSIRCDCPTHDHKAPGGHRGFYVMPKFCQTSGCTRKASQWHHKDFDNRNNCRKNLKALCRKCHDLIHGRESVGGWNKGLKQDQAERDMRSRATKAGMRRKRIERARAS